MKENKLLLLDTSAWIVSFRKSCNAEWQQRLRQEIIANHVVTAYPIYLELMVGCRTEKEKSSLQLLFQTLDILEMDESIWNHAADIGFELKRNGVTVSSVDLLIVSLTIHNQCMLLHFDKHFSLIAKYIKGFHQQQIQKPSHYL